MKSRLSVASAALLAAAALADSQAGWAGAAPAICKPENYGPGFGRRRRIGLSPAQRLLKNQRKERSKSHD